MSSSQSVDFFKLSSDILSTITKKDLKHLVANLCIDEESQAIKQEIDKAFTDETILQTDGKETKSFLGETTFARRSFSIDITNFVEYDKIYSFALFENNKSITTASEIIKKSSNPKKGPRCNCFHQGSYLKNLPESSGRTGDFRILLCFVSERLEWFLTKNTYVNDGKKKKKEVAEVEEVEEVVPKSTKRKSTDNTTMNKKKKVDDAVSVETESNCQQEQPTMVQEENLQASVGNLPVTAQFSQNTFPNPEEFSKKFIDIFQSYFQLFSEHNNALKEIEELKQRLKLYERSDDQYVSQVLNVNLPAAATQEIGPSLSMSVLSIDELFVEEGEKENSQEKNETSMKTLEFSGTDQQPIIAEKNTCGQMLESDDEFLSFINDHNFM